VTDCGRHRLGPHAGGVTRSADVGARGVRVGVAVVAALAVVSVGSPAHAAHGVARADYRIVVAGPADVLGRPTGTHVVAGVPFFVRLELFTSVRSGPASVSYALDLPTKVSLFRHPRHVPKGGVSTTCLRDCSVGWLITQRMRKLTLYYAVVVPGPGEFIIEARIESTDRPDTQKANDEDSLTIIGEAAGLAVGVPVSRTPAPVAGRPFVVTVAVRRAGEPVKPTGARCIATIERRALLGVASIRRGRVTCTWRMPSHSTGALLRATVRVAARSLTAARSRSFRIRASS
jgi:hypothetical protein